MATLFLHDDKLLRVSRWWILIPLGLAYINVYFTRVVYLLCRVFWGIVFVLSPASSVETTLLHATTWSSEWRYTSLSDWVYAYWRLAQMHHRVDVVIAYYREDLSWIAPYLNKIDHLYLYCKDVERCHYGLPQILTGRSYGYAYCQMKVGRCIRICITLLHIIWICHNVRYLRWDLFKVIGCGI